ncbi:hypothetical protein ACHAPJ_001173 [Fusarium lateritium]
MSQRVLAPFAQHSQQVTPNSDMHPTDEKMMFNVRNRCTAIAHKIIWEKDPFSRLPKEIQLLILLQLHAIDIGRLCQASHSMNKSFKISKDYITEEFIKADFDSEMLQDAMAIILFPVVDLSSETRCSHLKESVPMHLNHWAAQKIVDPFERARKQYIKQRDRPLIDIIYQFHHKMLLYIEDYLTKATSKPPRQAYLYLPDLSTGKSILKGQPLEEEIDMYALSISERKRLLWAFLRYELISKVYLYKKVVHPEYIPVAALYKRQGRQFRLRESEALQCVHIYIEHLYGALLAQCGHAWMQDTLSTSASAQFPDTSLPPGHLLPNHMTYQLGLYTNDFGVWDTEWALTTLANFGFDVITHLIPAATEPKGFHKLQKWLEVFSKKVPYDFQFDGTNVHTKYHSSFLPEYSGDMPFRAADSRLERRRIYRQRAWVFFDGSRLYPRDIELWTWPLFCPWSWKENMNTISRLTLTRSLNPLDINKRQDYSDVDAMIEYGVLPRFLDNHKRGPLVAFWR